MQLEGRLMFLSRVAGIYSREEFRDALLREGL